jgi:hypothetical protein
MTETKEEKALELLDRLTALKDEEERRLQSVAPRPVLREDFLGAKFRKGDRVRHVESGRTGTVIAVVLTRS